MEANRKALVIPVLGAEQLLSQGLGECELADTESMLLVPSASFAPRRGRKEQAYGRPARCTHCRRPPRYRNGLLIDCSCGAAANPHAPPVLVRVLEGDE